ncbi:MAG: DUF4293 domain-containing protein [Bacteroidales bacterium]|jgi:hypothetical protein|nr:DUF4293 domain-containing protein [Bacteroidales bacterium]
MIQRIQSLFLFVAAGLIFSMLFTPMITLMDGETIYYAERYDMLVFILVTFVLAGTTFFSYKNRMFQIRLCVLNSLILLGWQALIAVLFFKREPVMIFSLTAVFPIVASVLTFLALRYISRDEAMIRAASRLRKGRR